MPGPDQIGSNQPASDIGPVNHAASPKFRQQGGERTNDPKTGNCGGRTGQLIEVDMDRDEVNKISKLGDTE